MDRNQYDAQRPKFEIDVLDWQILHQIQISSWKLENVSAVTCAKGISELTTHYPLVYFSYLDFIQKVLPSHYNKWPLSLFDKTSGLLTFGPLNLDVYLIPIYNLKVLFCYINDKM